MILKADEQKLNRKCVYCGTPATPKWKANQKFCPGRGCSSRFHDGKKTGKSYLKPSFCARGAVDANPNAFNVNACEDQQPRMLVIPIPSEKGAAK